MTKKIGLIDENNKLVKNEIKKGLSHIIKDDTKVDAALTECFVEKDIPEETAYVLWKCMLKQAKAI